MWLRRSLVETEQFEENAEKARATKHPLLQTIKHHPKAVVQLCAFTLLSTLSYYTFFSALTPFAITFRGADKTDVFIALSIGTALFVALCFPFGKLSDHIGRKPQLLIWSGAMAVLIVPLSFLVRDNLLSLIVVFCTGLRSEEHTSELQSRQYIVCRLLLEKNKHCALADCSAAA